MYFLIDFIFLGAQLGEVLADQIKTFLLLILTYSRSQYLFHHLHQPWYSKQFSKTSAVFPLRKSGIQKTKTSFCFVCRLAAAAAIEYLIIISVGLFHWSLSHLLPFVIYIVLFCVQSEMEIALEWWQAWHLFIFFLFLLMTISSTLS